MALITDITSPFWTIWKFLKQAAADDRTKRDFRAENDLLNALRHADFNSHKYVITLFMKSGRTVVGRIGTGDYDHKSYDKYRGTLTVSPEREYPDGVFYELCEIRLSEVEGYILQDVNHERPEVMKRLRKEAQSGLNVIGEAPGSKE